MSVVFYRKKKQSQIIIEKNREVVWYPNHSDSPMVLQGWLGTRVLRRISGFNSVFGLDGTKWLFTAHNINMESRDLDSRSKLIF